MDYLKLNKIKFICHILLVLNAFIFSNCSSSDVAPAVTDSQVAVTSTIVKDNYELDATLNYIFKDVFSVLNNEYNSVVSITTVAGFNSPNLTTFGTNLINYTISQDRKIYTITFSGISDNLGITKTGKITVNLNIGAGFTTAGADFGLKFENIKLAHGTYNYLLTAGNFSFKNINGGFPDAKTLSNSNVQFWISGYSNIQLATNYSYGYSIGRVSNWTLSNGEILESITAYSVADGFTDLVSYGKSPSGLKFYTKINAPIVLAHNRCSSFKPISGEYNSVVLNTSDGTTYFVYKPNIVSGCFSNYTLTTTNSKGSNKVSTINLINW